MLQHMSPGRGVRPGIAVNFASKDRYAKDLVGLAMAV